MADTPTIAELIALVQDQVTQLEALAEKAPYTAHELELWRDILAIVQQHEALQAELDAAFLDALLVRHRMRRSEQQSRTATTQSARRRQTGGTMTGTEPAPTHWAMALEQETGLVVAHKVAESWAHLTHGAVLDGKLFAMIRQAAADAIKEQRADAYRAGIERAAVVAKEAAMECERERKRSTDRELMTCNLWSQQTAGDIERKIRGLAAPQSGGEGDKSGERK